MFNLCTKLEFLCSKLQPVEEPADNNDTDDNDNDDKRQFMIIWAHFHFYQMSQKGKDGDCFVVSLVRAN